MDNPSTLHIGNLAEGGGLERYFRELVCRLSRGDGGALGMVLGRDNVDNAFLAFAAPHDPLPERLYKMRRVFLRARKAFPVDGVVAHFPLYAFPILHRLDIPLLVHFHGPWAEESLWEGGRGVSTWMKRQIEQWVYRRAEHFIVLSEAFGELLQRLHGVPDRRLSVIPGGVDMERFRAIPPREEARRALGWPLDRPILFTVRRLVPRMGLENLIHAMERIKRVYPDAWLAVAGRGPLGHTLAKRVHERGLEGHVFLEGYLSEKRLALAYRAADLCVVPSSALEGFGLVAAESLAAGTPVLVTPVGGLPEVVGGLAPELVLSGTDGDALADGIIEALRGERVLPSASDCRRHAWSFDWEQVIPKLHRVYQGVVG